MIFIREYYKRNKILQVHNWSAVDFAFFLFLFFKDERECLHKYKKGATSIQSSLVSKKKGKHSLQSINKAIKVLPEWRGQQFERPLKQNTDKTIIKKFSLTADILASCLRRRQTCIQMLSHISWTGPKYAALTPWACAHTQCQIKADAIKYPSTVWQVHTFLSHYIQQMHVSTNHTHTDV